MCVSVWTMIGRSKLSCASDALSRVIHILHYMHWHSESIDAVKFTVHRKPYRPRHNIKSVVRRQKSIFVKLCVTHKKSRTNEKKTLNFNASVEHGAIKWPLKDIRGCESLPKSKTKKRRKAVIIGCGRPSQHNTLDWTMHRNKFLMEWECEWERRKALKKRKEKSEKLHLVIISIAHVNWSIESQSQREHAIAQWWVSKIITIINENSSIRLFFSLRYNQISIADSNRSKTGGSMAHRGLHRK